jgi:DNA-binding transcriptional LysR family regulator
MDLRQLRAFVTVARFSSVTKAAEALHLTQPAVSGQLRSLEEDLQVKLLNRTTSSVVLTPTGQELLILAEDAIDAFGRFAHAAHMRRGKIEGKLRIGVVMVDPEALRVGPLLAKLTQTSPGLAIGLQVGRTSWMVDSLRSAEIDAALLLGRSPPVGTSWIELDNVRFRVAIPASWQQRFDSTNLQQLSDVPWIRMAQRSAHRELMSDLLSTTAVTPRETVEVDHELMMLELVSAGIGVGLIREELAAQAVRSGKLCYFGDHCVTSSLAFAYPEGRAGDPLILAVCDALRSVWPVAGGSLHEKTSASHKAIATRNE